MTDMVIMPRKDYLDICEKIRLHIEKEPIKSGEVGDLILKVYLKGYGEAGEIIDKYGEMQEDVKWLIEAGERDEFTNDTATRIRAYAFYYASSSASNMKFGSVETIGTGAFRNNTALKIVMVPKNKDMKSSVFQSCSNLEFADIGFTDSLSSTVFSSDAKLKAVVLRKTDAPTTLKNVSAFDGTPFATGGTGGTVYVPDTLRATYEQAANWSALNCTFLPLEGSEYE